MSTAAFTFPASQYGVEAGLVADALSKMVEGEVIEYGTLTKLSGVNVLRFRNVLQSARKVVLKEKQMGFKSIRGVGLMRMTNEQMGGFGIETVKRLGRMARKGIKVVSAADYDRLSPEGRVRQMVGLSLLNTSQHMSSSSSIKKISTAATVGTRILPLQQMLQMMATT